MNHITRLIYTENFRIISSKICFEHQRIIKLSDKLAEQA